jgi:hypothetical protein
MGMQDYRLILETACASSSTWNADSIFYGSPVVSNGLRVWFQYFAPADLCRIVIDLGPIEDKARAPVWQMMLESNCKSTSEFLPFMALHPSNGNAILVMHLSMEKFDSHARKPDFFRHLDEMLAPLVESWRKGNDAIGSNGQVVSSIFGGGFA